MSLTLAPQPLPLSRDADGVIRVGGTRVTLDTVWAAFSDGASAEEIAERYPSLAIADVYQSLGYCLARPQELESYLSQRRLHRNAVQAENENRLASDGLRQRLLTRKATQGRSSC
jgi:uncharacterized protein (DUF433 family)